MSKNETLDAVMGLLDEVEQDFQNSEGFSLWDPPVGPNGRATYSCVLTGLDVAAQKYGKYRDGETEEETPCVRFLPQFTVFDHPEFSGRSFGGGFYTTRTGKIKKDGSEASVNDIDKTKTLFANLLGCEEAELPSIKDCIQRINDGCVNRMTYEVEAKSRNYKGNEYRDYNILSVLGPLEEAPAS